MVQTQDSGSGAPTVELPSRFNLGTEGSPWNGSLTEDCGDPWDRDGKGGPRGTL